VGTECRRANGPPALVATPAWPAPPGDRHRADEEEQHEAEAGQEQQGENSRHHPARVAALSQDGFNSEQDRGVIDEGQEGPEVIEEHDEGIVAGPPHNSKHRQRTLNGRMANLSLATQLLAHIQDIAAQSSCEDRSRKRCTRRAQSETRVAR
jgi:hypothetical protein